MSRPAEVLPLSVVVPVRNAAAFLEDCLVSIVDSGVHELIVVDGESTDDSVEIAERHGASVLSDGGRGLPVARMLGAQQATCRRVALIDADVVVPPGALAALLDEFETGGYAALQAGLHSVSGDGYWGQALAYHHRTGRSKNWFGLVATVFDRDVLLDHGFDESFISGEDIEMRWRLADRGVKTGVSQRTIVVHRFVEDSFEFALGQFRADGRGLARMVRQRGLRGVRLLFLPVLAAGRGIVLCLVRLRPRWIPYYVVYAVMNYVAMLSLIWDKDGDR